MMSLLLKSFSSSGFLWASAQRKTRTVAEKPGCSVYESEQVLLA
jgi:hypothetical protein